MSIFNDSQNSINTVSFSIGLGSQSLEATKKIVKFTNLDDNLKQLLRENIDELFDFKGLDNANKKALVESVLMREKGNNGSEIIRERISELLCHITMINENRVFLEYTHNISSPSEEKKGVDGAYFDNSCILLMESKSVQDTAHEIKDYEGKVGSHLKKAIHSLSTRVINFNDQFSNIATLKTHLLSKRDTLLRRISKKTFDDILCDVSDGLHADYNIGLMATTGINTCPKIIESCDLDFFNYRPHQKTLNILCDKKPIEFIVITLSFLDELTNYFINGEYL